MSTSHRLWGIYMDNDRLLQWILLYQVLCRRTGQCEWLLSQRILLNILTRIQPTEETTDNAFIDKYDHFCFYFNQFICKRTSVKVFLSNGTYRQINY